MTGSDVAKDLAQKARFFLWLGLAVVIVLLVVVATENPPSDSLSSPNPVVMLEDIAQDFSLPTSKVTLLVKRSVEDRCPLQVSWTVAWATVDFGH